MDATQATTGAPKELTVTQRWVAIIFLLISMICEGFDLQGASYVAPDIAREFGVEKTALTPYLTAGLVGMMVGAPFMGGLGDRFGRKTMVIGGALTYGVFTLMSVWSTSLEMLTVFRFLIGVGIGAVLPNSIILAGEYAPPALRVKAAAFVTTGIGLGGTIVGLVAHEVLQEHSWRAVWMIGGILPFAISAMLYFGIPESPEFKKVETQVATGGKFAVPTFLFEGPYKLITPVLWFTLGLLSLSLYLTTGWTPMLLNQSGLSVSDAALVASVYHGAGTIGGIIGAFVIARSGWSTLSAYLGLAAVTLILLVITGGTTAPLIAGLAGAGFFITGAQTCMNGASGLAYPVSVRARGVGVAIGVSRLGSVLGPMIGGLALAYVLAQNFPPRVVFLSAVIPLTISAIGAAWLAWYVAKHPAVD
jgi:AAHS family 4-hydroxybenzoate transporter-like MFS transporter